MKIYFAHRVRGFDFEDFYAAVKELDLEHELIFPHVEGKDGFNTLDFLLNDLGDKLVIVNSTVFSEGWYAEAFMALGAGVPVAFIQEKGIEIHRHVHPHFSWIAEYESRDQMKEKIREIVTAAETLYSR